MLSTDKYSNPDMPEEAQDEEAPTPAVESMHMVTVPTSIVHTVEIKELGAPLGGAHTVALIGGQVELLLPNDPTRRSAILLPVDADVWIASSLEQAQASAGANTGSSGFYLPKGTPVKVETTSPMWAAPTSGTLARISVMTFRDA